MTLIAIDRRTAQVHVPRAALGAAAENALAGSRNAADAVERAIGHAIAHNQAGVIHELSRVGFELEGRLEALTYLTQLAESAARCPDDIAAPGHGNAA